ncbi:MULTISPECIES: hypothetical protein [unclassified Haloarcula]|uniref:hypothetical protein n=1 Tax=unclassified Haloarcula TaxID=2624677 RepID=UPI000EF1DA0F|nr:MULTISPECIES: hypothetical protein [unclassified Haloarcula]RLM37207.1 hypothetical protein DVK01_11450 [Haloarcula sp. Atlit-120R]RLM44403.1 hypothetical protein DVK00_08010 [Haloarcula sp. Atlit-47R]
MTESKSEGGVEQIEPTTVVQYDDATTGDIVLIQQPVFGHGLVWDDSNGELVAVDDSYTVLDRIPVDVDECVDMPDYTTDVTALWMPDIHVTSVRNGSVTIMDDSGRVGRIVPAGD